MNNNIYCWNPEYKEYAKRERNNQAIEQLLVKVKQRGRGEGGQHSHPLI